MNKTLYTKTRAAVGSLSLLFAVGSASAIDFSFTQTGFAGGGTVTGSFSGEDVDGNGYINYAPADAAFFDPATAAGLLEVTDFMLSFTGSSVISDFTLGFSSLQMFSFMYPGDAIIGNDFDASPVDTVDFYSVEGIHADDGTFMYFSGQQALYAFGQETMVSENTPNGPIMDGGSSFSIQGGGTATVPDATSTGLWFGVLLPALLVIRRKFAVSR